MLRGFYIVHCVKNKKKNYFASCKIKPVLHNLHTMKIYNKLYYNIYTEKQKVNFQNSKHKFLGNITLIQN